MNALSIKQSVFEKVIGFFFGILHITELVNRRETFFFVVSDIL